MKEEIYSYTLNNTGWTKNDLHIPTLYIFKMAKQHSSKMATRTFTNLLHDANGYLP